MNWILCEDPEVPLWCLRPMEKCTQTRKHKKMFTILISSWRCNYSKKRLLFYRFENSAKTTEIPTSGSAVTNHGWPKRRRHLFATWTISCRLLFPGYPPILVAFRLQHRQSTLQELSSRTPAQERSDGLAPENWCGSPSKTQNKNNKRDGSRDSDDRLRDLPEWLEEFTDNPEDTEVHAPAHISQDSDSERSTKVGWTSRKQSYLLTSQKTEIAKSCEPKWQGLLAEDALAKQYLEQKNLVTWKRLITKSSTRRVNHGTITDMLSLFKILPLNGFILTCAKHKLLRKRKRVHESFSSHQKSQKSFTLTIHWKLANLVKIYHRIIELQHLIDPRQMALLKESYEEWKKEFQQLLQSGLDEKWWADSMECYRYLRNVQNFLTDGETPYERWFGEPLKGQLFLFGAVVEYRPARYQSRLHQFGKKV